MLKETSFFGTSIRDILRIMYINASFAKCSDVGMPHPIVLNKYLQVLSDYFGISGTVVEIKIKNKFLKRFVRELKMYSTLVSLLFTIEVKASHLSKKESIQE